MALARENFTQTLARENFTQMQTNGKYEKKCFEMI
jgi:hypothetical protein